MRKVGSWRQVQNVFLGLSFFALPIVGGACGSPPPGVTVVTQETVQGCGPGMAVIQVGDGFLMPLCGCQGAGEANGTVFQVSNPLTCHLSGQTSVVFLFTGTQLWHQIV